jgi:hypothetical protein
MQGNHITVQTDRTIRNKKPDSTIRDNESVPFVLILADVAASGDRNVFKREAEIISRFFTMVQQPIEGQNLRLSRLYNHTQTHLTLEDSCGRVIIPTHRPLPDNTQHLEEKDIHSSRRDSNPPVPPSEWSQTHSLDRAATEFSPWDINLSKIHAFHI